MRWLGEACRTTGEAQRLILRGGSLDHVYRRDFASEETGSEVNWYTKGGGTQEHPEHGTSPVMSFLKRLGVEENWPSP